MENYITLLDNSFLPQVLALHKSMERHTKNYILWILCLDDETFIVLKKLQLDKVKLLELNLFETEKLIEVKKHRSRGEYCWTLTPYSPKFVFDSDPSVDRVTYIDADIWFRNNPAPIFQEFEESGKHVLITEHSYAAEYDQSEFVGRFCVQFITFSRYKGEVVRKYWENMCTEWCFARFEDGKFGDQKYLDDWPQRFTDYVHVLKNKEYALGPWNAIRYPYGASIFYHFHDLRIKNELNVERDSYYHIPKVVKDQLYDKYTIDLFDSIKTLKKVGYQIKYQVRTKNRLVLFLLQIILRIRNTIRSKLRIPNM